MTPLISKDANFRQPFSTVNTRVYTAIIPVIENTAGLICSYFLPGPRPRSSAVLCSSTVHYGTVQYSTVQYSTGHAPVQCSVV